MTILSAGAAGCAGGGARPSSRDAAADRLATDGVDAAAAGVTCQDIRTCATDCATAACLNACIARGSTSAAELFNELLTCLMTIDQRPMSTATPCTGVDPGCYCREECNADGYCLDEVAACLDASPDVLADMVCDGTCGG